ncbi:hypothetical protein BO86DRAFT_72227 [Aspergillus japonicus CBS 114.51]|uniref:Uncharacterized protein n=2 Tax=Aspergillus TaxID=5052 RepID=A0A2V5H983_ASPV1|nr:hypothetical protein BO86DRAFT_72227 [Aspergillus japonicus CBS 114.51]PYI20895.1 hypothetical protein BO99DRAFT_103574 [Aspergillus violaceofuscus CBS 115571]RAH82597.1 hypothetical protein BO86DRAFT_72227 [Aspergillus japonicus CBS 114.51]
MGRNISHGRGGAGNIFSGTGESRTTPKDLVTPTIKQDVFTTGRGGSGNMMQNDPQHPELARELQDVETPPLRMEEAPHHTGRGGVANAYFPTPEEEKRMREQGEAQLARVKTQEAQLARVRTQSKDRRKDLEHTAGAAAVASGALSGSESRPASEERQPSSS